MNIVNHFFYDTMQETHKISEFIQVYSMINLHFVCTNVYILPSSSGPLHSLSATTDRTQKPKSKFHLQVLDSVQDLLLADILTVLWHRIMRDFSNGKILKW